MSVSINGTTGLITAGASSSGGGGVASNTALGGDALVANTTGASNTAIGDSALRSNSTASDNTAVGYQAGYSNTTGTALQAFGRNALYSNSTGVANVAIGGEYVANSVSALSGNTTGSYNIAVGTGALGANTTASNNTAVGYQAGYTQAGNANGNTLLGYQAGYTGNSFIDVNSFNTHVGYQAGYSNTTGIKNTFIGAGAGTAVTTGYNNTILGRYSGNGGGLDIRTASNHIVLSDGDGNPRAWFRGSDGLLFCPAMYAVTSGNSANVVVNSDGGVLRSTSALKYKQDIRNLESIDINKFRPIRYKSKCEGDDQTKDFIGFIADEVDAAGIKELVQYGTDGEIEGFSYDRLTAVLVKTIQDLQKRIEILENK
jgi:hypothetical protein